MGLYDRDYSRRPDPGIHLSAPQSATVQLVLLTGVVYLLQLLSPRVTTELALQADWWRRPWEVYQLLTYGFLHDPSDVRHILINMLVFWVFGRELEARYGRGEFVTFYLLGIVFSGLAWSLIETALGSAQPHGFQLTVDETGKLMALQTAVPTALGASGGIAGVVALYAANFPHRQILFMFIIPMPMWMFAALGVLMDANGAIHRSGNVAFTAHLAGAAYGLAYYFFHWRLAPWLARGGSLLSARTRRSCACMNRTSPTSPMT